MRTQITIADLPLYNADIDDPSLRPVARLRDAIRSADAVLIISPEYNFSMAGATKNALDWASRPSDDSCLDGKPVGLAGCAAGGFGTVRAKLALLPVLHTTNMES